MRIKKWHVALTTALVTAAVGGGLFCYYAYTVDQKTSAMVAEYESQLSVLESQVSSVKKDVYVPMVDIKPGEEITEEKVTVKTVYSDSTAEVFMTNEDIGSLALIPLATDVPIYSVAVSKNDYNELQESEVNFVNLNTNLQDNDTVDIRIVFPNGEDYVVLAKQVLRSLNLAAADFYLWMTEEEILSLDSAAVDANLNGGTLYVTRYIEPEAQEASIVNYQPNVDVMELMATDPNIVSLSKRKLSVKARKELEDRLKAFSSQYSEDDEKNGNSNSGTSRVTASPAPAVTTGGNTSGSGSSNYGATTTAGSGTTTDTSSGGSTTPTVQNSTSDGSSSPTVETDTNGASVVQTPAQ